MADIILATLLLGCGAAWSFICLGAAAMDPVGRSPWKTVGGQLAVALAATVAGLAYWAWIIFG